MNEMEYVKTLFNMLRENNIQFCVLEIDKEKRLVDIFINKNDYALFKKIMKKYYNKVEVDINTYAYIYKLEPDIFWVSSDGGQIHSACQMSCISLSNLSKCKLPLDESIQKSIWSNKVWDDQNDCWRICKEDYMIYLLVTCIFNQKAFDQKSVEWIRNANVDLKSKTLIYKLEGVFFKFTPELLRLIENERFEKIIYEYRTFRCY